MRLWGWGKALEFVKKIRKGFSDAGIGVKAF